MNKNYQGTDYMDMIRENTGEEINRRIDRYIEDNIRYYATQAEDIITGRINTLEKEWDVQKLVQAIDSGIGLGSILLGVLGSKKWWFVTTLAAASSGMSAVKGWSPCTMALRRMGFRTRQEIDREKYALKALRGDFNELTKHEPDKVDERIKAAIEATKTL
ncbi:MAG: hypothetical protein ACOC4R_01230 [Bacteroidota bacterium]